MRKGLIISIFLVLGNFGLAQDQAAYIRQYQDLAVSEMVRSGIPASIKLAQGMLESGCGQSDLACKANNHFGIKCGGDWKGKSFHKEDDDYEDGKLVKSCFREFHCVRDSYIAHSDFLTDPVKVNRYGFLFDLEITDYKGWAKGLSKAGYATDPLYANRLIDLIEKYELFRFDNEFENEMVTVSTAPSKSALTIRTFNDVKYTLALNGDNPTLIAKRYDVTVIQLLKYNDDITSKSQNLITGSKVYLQPKRSRYHGRQKYHTIRPGEDMISISQQYGIRLDALLKRNKLEENEVPVPKQKIILSGRLKKDLLKADPYQIPEEKKTPANHLNPTSGEVIVNSTEDRLMVSADNTRDSMDMAVVNMVKSVSIHTVSKGETLYGIARTYGLSVVDLKKKNNLSADTIFVGQKLVCQ